MTDFKPGEWIVPVTNGANNTSHPDYKNSYTEGKAYKILEIGKSHGPEPGEDVYVCNNGVVIYAYGSFKGYVRKALPEEIPSEIVEDFQIY